MIGAVVHNGKFGYGVIWRTDKFGRYSVKFESGKEVGGFSETEFRKVENTEFESNGLLEKFKFAGIDRNITMDPEQYAAKAKVEDMMNNLSTVKSIYKEAAELVEHGARVDEVASKIAIVLDESPMDNFTKGKIKKRTARMESTERLLNYLDNSLKRLNQIDKSNSLFKLNVTLTETLSILKKN